MANRVHHSSKGRLYNLQSLNRATGVRFQTGYDVLLATTLRRDLKLTSLLSNRHWVLFSGGKIVGSWTSIMLFPFMKWCLRTDKQSANVRVSKQYVYVNSRVLPCFRLEDLEMANVKDALFWGQKPCTMVVINVSEEHTASIFRVENGGSMLLWNIGNNMASHPIRLKILCLACLNDFLCYYFQLLRR
jgi:hypothetical protein